MRRFVFLFALLVLCAGLWASLLDLRAGAGYVSCDFEEVQVMNATGFIGSFGVGFNVPALPFAFVGEGMYFGGSGWNGLLFSLGLRGRLDFVLVSPFLGVNLGLGQVSGNVNADDLLSLQPAFGLQLRPPMTKWGVELEGGYIWFLGDEGDGFTVRVSLLREMF